MTKAELIELLEPFTDEIEISVSVSGSWPNVTPLVQYRVNEEHVGYLVLEV